LAGGTFSNVTSSTPSLSVALTLSGLTSAGSSWSRRLSLHYCELLTKNEVLQGDFPDILWRKKQTQQRGEEREHEEEYRRSPVEKSAIFRQMWY
jgi:hypothetical protein